MGMNCYGPIRVRQSDCELMVCPNMKKVGSLWQMSACVKGQGYIIIIVAMLCVLYKIRTLGQGGGTSLHSIC